MEYMFYSASAFNRNIGSWNLSQVTNMNQMFQYVSVFNQSLCAWGPAIAQSQPFVTDMFSNTACSSQNAPNVTVLPVQPLCAQTCPVPTKAPTKVPTKVTTKAPTKLPTKMPTKFPSKAPLKVPTKAPINAPTMAPVAPPVSCGLFCLNFFCPQPGKCGFWRRMLNLGGC
jgi:surface protein